MRLIIAAALALACSPVIAEDCPLNYDLAIETIEANGGKIVGAASYDGTVSSELLVVELLGAITIIGFDADGCYVGEKTLEPAKPKEPGA